MVVIYVNNSIKSSYSFYNLGQYEPVVVSDFPEIMINMHGDVFSVSSGKKINPYHYDRQYDSIHTRDLLGKHHVVGVHQLVSMTFDNSWYRGCIVHHIDEDKYNNSIFNLCVLCREEHGRFHKQKYVDRESVCDICGEKFIWTSKRQANYFADLRIGRNRIITCSKRCSSYAGRMKQLGRKI